MSHNLRELLHGVDVQHYAEGPVPGGLPYVDVAHVASDSRDIKAGDLFISCAKDPLKEPAYLEQALDRGASVILLEQGAKLSEHLRAKAASHGAVLLQTPNARYALSRIAARLFPHVPDTLAAVTGTNGKSSVASFVRQIWSAAGHQAAYWGTVGLEADVTGIVPQSTLTTPDPMVLSKTLEQLAHAGITHVSLEASSIGLDQERLSGISLQAAAFTQFTQDHLDYHGTMEKYFEAKIRLFRDILSPQGTAVLNSDVSEFETLKNMCENRGIKIISYGQKSSDLRIRSIQPIADGYEVDCEVFGKKEILQVPLMGEFQVYNSLAALGLAIATGVEPSLAIQAVSYLKSVAGRMERAGQTAGGATIYVDYAHTPDALANVLKSLRPHTTGHLWVVFGCGGDRDAGKRPLMGQVAAQLADHVIVTDDNPRTEDPTVIRAQILAGCQADVLEIADRAQAIEMACKKAKTGDRIIIAGKGHEQGQIVGTQILPFDDLHVARAHCVSDKA
jgi:UDP-N-acetylmuramoyl-L-alanyl-D-glutamate--2,6-diaminopimelate ligase